MKKPVCYLWKKDFTSSKKFEETKKGLVSQGFRVVTYQDGDPQKDIHEGLKAVICNHI